MSSGLPDPTLEALWKRVLDAWDDDRAHGAFLQHCQQTDALGEAAARYKGMAGDRDRGAAATKKLEAVSMLAVHTLLAARSEPRRGPPRWLLIVVVILLGGATAWIGLKSWTMMANGP